MRAFFAGREVDLDARAVVFSLFGAQARVFSLMEREALRPIGLTHAGFVTLMCLWTLGPLETRVLAGTLAISRPAVVSAVNTLETRGWVRRVRSDEDRRLVTLVLTAAGRRTVERAQAATHAYERTLAASLTREEQRTLTSLLSRLETAAKTVRHSAGTLGVR
jgi:DNA-binding MarR family transcriptional regulator